MGIAIITGAGGLIGSEACRYFSQQGFEIIGIDNDMRKYFFGANASTSWMVSRLSKEIKKFKNLSLDIRDQEGIEALFKNHSKDIEIVIHAAAQPSHDWAAQEPHTDFSINATGTLNLLEAYRKHSPSAVFIFTSTNKVYGDRPNTLPLIESDTRWEIDKNHPYYDHGIDENMNIDQCLHSLFGASKVAADVLVQEYGKYFGLKTGVFRGGCLTGPAHSGAKLHGFLAYLVQCVLTGAHYSVYGYKGKQVRDNIHSFDLISSFWHFFNNPRSGEVYNMGGSRHSHCSMLEAIQLTEQLSNKKLNFTLCEDARKGDHIWWVSDIRKFQNHYPNWNYQYNIKKILEEIIENTKERL